MRNHYYILDENGNPKACGDILDWGRWMSTHDKNRILAHTKYNDKTLISTVFLGADHQFGKGPPLLYESMIFGGEKIKDTPFEKFQERYSAKEEALKGHKKLCDEVEDWDHTLIKVIQP